MPSIPLPVLLGRGRTASTAVMAAPAAAVLEPSQATLVMASFLLTSPTTLLRLVCWSAAVWGASEAVLALFTPARLGEGTSKPEGWLEGRVLPDLAHAGL